MSKLWSRKGTLAQKFNFDITIHSVRIALNLPVNISALWKKSSKRISTSSDAVLTPEVGYANIEERLSMVNTLYRRKRNNEYFPKKANITINAIIGNKKKRIGVITLEL